MSRKISFVVGGSILIVAVTIAITLVALRPDTVRQPPPLRTPFVGTDSVVTGDGVIPIYGGGTVRPHKELSVIAEVSGQVVWTNAAFQSGGQVSSGDTLFRIDDVDYLSQVKRAQANVSAQEVELIRVTAEAEIAGVQFENWDDQDTTKFPTPLALWKPQVKAIQAALNRDEAELIEAEFRLSRTVIRSPFAAAVVSESITVGQFVSAGQSVGRLYAIDTVEVVLSLPDESAALIPRLWKLEPGKKNRNVSANVIAKYGDTHYSWNGYVDRAKAALEEQTRTIEVVIQVPDPFSAGVAINRDLPSGNAPPLLIGKFVDVKIDGLFSGQFYKVRRSALRPGNEVWAIQDEILHRIPVQVIQRSDDEIFLTGALENVKEVVVSGLQTAIDGMSVRTGS